MGGVCLESRFNEHKRFASSAHPSPRISVFRRPADSSFKTISCLCCSSASFSSFSITASRFFAFSFISKSSWIRWLADCSANARLSTICLRSASFTDWRCLRSERRRYSSWGKRISDLKRCEKITLFSKAWYCLWVHSCALYCSIHVTCALYKVCTCSVFFWPEVVQNIASYNSPT